MDRELAFITEIIQEAGALLVAESLRPDGPRGAGSKMPVDTEMERLLKGHLARAFPEDAVISEETGGASGTSGRAFVIDPHDGTSDFLKGRRETSVSIGLVDRGQMVLGAVYMPIPGPMIGPEPLLVTWARGDTLRVNQEPFTPPPAPTELTQESLVLVSANLSDRRIAENSHMVAPGRALRCSSVATRWALVALGRADAGLTIFNTLAPWDFAGAQALLQSQGGDIVDGQGRPITWQGIHPGWQAAHFFGARTPALAAEVARRYRDYFMSTRGHF